jgi:hypothetical protein
MQLYKLTPIILMTCILLNSPLLCAAEESIASIAQPTKRTTNMEFKTTIRPEPDSFRSLGSIPPNTAILILDKQVIQDGKAKVNWYLIDHQGVQGWISGLNLNNPDGEMTYSISYESPNGSRKPMFGAGF